MYNINKCPLCQLSQIEVYPISSNDMYRIICKRCGEFKISEECLDQKEEHLKEIGYVLSGLNREIRRDKGKCLEFLTSNIEKYTSEYPVPDLNNVEQKASKLLKYIKNRTSYFGQNVGIRMNTDIPVAYARNGQELFALIDLLVQKKLVKSFDANIEGEQAKSVYLQADGWNLANESSKNRQSDKGFIAVWFDDSMKESIEVMEDVVRDIGYEPICIKDKFFSETIMDKALGEIRESRFVIVDLTGARESVYFEAGFAFGLGIDSIYVYKDCDGESPPLDFYVKHYQCYKYKDSTDLKNILKNAINARVAK